MKNFLKYVAIIGLFTASVACENKSSNSAPQAVAPAADPTMDPLAVGEAVEAQSMIAPSGSAVTTSTVVAHESGVGEAPAGNEGMPWDEIIATYPALADRVGFLASIAKVVETDARTFDLYSVAVAAYATANEARPAEAAAAIAAAAALGGAATGPAVATATTVVHPGSTGAPGATVVHGPVSTRATDAGVPHQAAPPGVPPDAHPVLGVAHPTRVRTQVRAR